jgi:predicted RNA-binding Zn-ribbon protein involved in translation (DUF1610 family)
MTDLIAKLRRCGIDDAADELERLTAANAALTEANGKWTVTCTDLRAQLAYAASTGDECAIEVEALRSRLADAQAYGKAQQRWAHELRGRNDALQAQLAGADLLLRPCPNCGMALALCYDAKRTGKIACCPDCRHDAHLAREQP